MVRGTLTSEDLMAPGTSSALVTPSRTSSTTWSTPERMSPALASWPAWPPT